MEGRRGETPSFALSRDGTRIAYDKLGHGPAVIVVEGALVTRRSWIKPSLADLLAPNFTAVTFDRRGRGDSSDAASYSPKREVEDIDALVDQLGGSAFLYGISSGAALALYTATELGTKMRGLTIYDTAYNSDTEARKAFRKYREQLATLLSNGRRGDAAALFMKFAGAPDNVVESMRSGPAWPAVEALAPTLAYDAAILGEDGSIPTNLAENVSSPTLVLYGGVSPPFFRETAHALGRAITNAKLRVVEGQGHDVRPETLAPLLTEFFLSILSLPTVGTS